MATAPAQIARRLPPGPRGKFLVGHILELGGDWFGYLRNCQVTYGDTFLLRFFRVPVCVVTNPAGIEQVLVTNYANFIKSRDYRAIGNVLGHGLLNSEGEFWRRQRKQMQPAFQHDNIQAYGNAMVECTERMLESWHDGEQLDAHEAMMRLTLDIVARTLFGADVTGASSRFGHALQLMMDSYMAFAGIAYLLPRKVPLPRLPRLRRAVRGLDATLYELITERRARAADAPARDLLQILVNARDESGNQMSDQQLRDEMMTLFLAGHETTAIALSWTWYLLGKHPEIEARLIEELREVLGDRPPTPADLRRLPYTEMVMKESMRLYPPAWGVGREAVGDFDVNGYQLPAGTNVLMLQWLTHRDPRYFEQPERFDPERWREDPVRAGKLPRFTYFPFGAGPRVCIGAGFAMMEATLLLATIARRFHLELDPTHPVAMQAAITLRPKHGIKVKLQKRV